MNEESQTDWLEEAALVLRRAEQKYALERTHNPEEPHSTRPDLPLDQIKEIVRQFRSHHRNMNADDALHYLTLALRRGRRNDDLFGIYLMTAFKHKLPQKTWYYVDTWVDYCKHREVCDQLAINLAGRLVAEDKSRWKTLQGWSKSDQALRRRFSVLTMCRVLGRGSCKPKHVLKLIEPLMQDDSSEVQHAVAFAIRQVEKIDEPLSLAFLKKWKGRANHEIFRESMNQLSPQARMRLLKAKSHQ